MDEMLCSQLVGCSCLVMGNEQLHSVLLTGSCIFSSLLLMIGNGRRLLLCRDNSCCNEVGMNRLVLGRARNGWLQVVVGYNQRGGHNWS